MESGRLSIIDLNCEHFEICGGCSYRGIPYEEQLLAKDADIDSALAAAGIQADERLPIVGAPQTDHYRNKMEYTFGDEVKEGPMTLGMHRKKSYMSVVDIPDCKIVPPDFELVRAAVLEYFRNSGHSKYHKKSHLGFLRNLILRAGTRTGALSVNLVTTDCETLDAPAFTELILSLDTLSTEISILHTINNKRADAIFREDLRVLYGKSYHLERMMGLTFSVEPFAFFQTNTAAFEAMLTDAVGLMPEIGGTLFDIYCGAGTIALSLAPAARQVYGLELSEESVSAAKANALLNGITNCEFLCGDALESLEKLSAEGITPDCMVVDPPRMGMHVKAVRKVLSYRLPAILYISCNPRTFAENASLFLEAGYRLKALRGYDNFPFTKHVECVGLIARE